MEKRFYLGIGILLIFLLLGSFTALVMEQAMTPLRLQLQQAALEGLGEDPEAGIRLAQQAQARWFELRGRIAAVADHTPMEEIDGLFAELSIYARSGDMPHFCACCNRLSLLAQALADAHAFSLQSLL